MMLNLKHYDLFAPQVVHNSHKWKELHELALPLLSRGIETRCGAAMFLSRPLTRWDIS